MSKPIPPDTGPHPPVIQAPDRAKLAEIQILRAFAAALVAFEHAGDLFEAAQVSIAADPWWRGLGASGVDLFFVISGFIITRSVWGSDRPPTARDFAFRRWARIGPPYWFWSGVTFIWLSLRADGFGWGPVLKTITFIPVFDRAEFVLPIMHVGWSLSYEVLFYGAVSLALAARVHQPWVLLVLGLLMSGVCMWIDTPDVMANFLANPMWLEFCAGIMLAMSLRVLRRSSWWIGWLLITVGISAWMASAGISPVNLAECRRVLDNTLSWERVWFWGGPAVAVTAGALIVGAGSGGGIVRRGLVTLGDASYAWYLTQLITLPLAARLWRTLVGWDDAIAYFVWTLGLSAAVAIFALRWVEVPLYRACLAARTRYRELAATAPAATS